jgi:hypothetical protein
MSTIKITITNLNRVIIEIDADENSTIKELKETYAEKYAIEIEGELNAKKIEEAVLKAEYDFKFVLGSQILDNDKTLKDALLKGEVTINAIKRPLLYAECLRDIKDLDSTSSLIQKLTKREEILGREIDRDREERTPILASSFKDIVLAAVQQNGEALEDASEDLRKDRDVV